MPEQYAPTIEYIEQGNLQNCLLVEDESMDAHQRSIEELKDKPGPIRNTGLNVVCAQTSEIAKQYLKEAIRPFDLVVLDLALPRFEHGSMGPDNGLNVLKLARKLHKAKNILIVSAHSEFINVTRILGETNWVNKEGPYDSKVFQNAVQESLWAVARADSDRIFEERKEKLYPYFERSLVHHFGVCFSRVLQGVDCAKDAIANELLERFGLNPERDSEDFLLRQLGEINTVLDTGKENWSDLQEILGLSSRFSSKKVFTKRVPIAKLVMDLKEQLRPLRITMNVKIEIKSLPSAEVVSFGDDVQKVLSEMVLGPLVSPVWHSSLDDWSRELKLSPELTISGKIDRDCVVITVSDNSLIPAEPESKEMPYIQPGMGIPSGERFSRTWGFSVMQYVALQGGGRLSMKTASDENTISYKIPLAP